jgi:type IV pilus assembly protein PilW
VLHFKFEPAVANNSRDEDKIPTLKRWELGRGIVPLVEGIENLQIEYGIDADDDGVPDPYDANKDGAPDVYYAANPDDPDDAKTVGNWRNVTAVRFNLLSREIKGTPGYKDDKTYRLGVDAEGVLKEVEPDDPAYRHHVYSLVVVANNIAGRRQ